MLPANATNRAVAWSITSGGDFAAIGSGGLVNAIANGTVTVRAAAQDGSGVYGEKTISISGQDEDPGPGNMPRALTDNPTDIAVSGHISEGAVLTVTDLALGGSAADRAIRRWMEDDDYVFILGRNISLFGSFAGTLTLSLPVGAQYNGETVTILHAKQDGTLETYTVKVKDGKATFDVTSLSPFAVFLKDGPDGIPRRGDGSAPWTGWLLLGVSGAAAAALALARKKALQKR